MDRLNIRIPLRMAESTQAMIAASRNNMLRFSEHRRKEIREGISGDVGMPQACVGMATINSPEAAMYLA